MERFDTKDYRNNLAKEIKEKRKESREDAISLLQKEKETEKYNTADTENKNRIFSNLRLQEFFEGTEVYINEPFREESDEYDIDTIDTPLSRLSYASILETKSGKKYIERYIKQEVETGKEVLTDNFINEFFESQLLKSALQCGVLDKEKIIVPDIKLNKESNDAYYSEFIENIFTLAKTPKELARYHNIDAYNYEQNKVKWPAEKIWVMEDQYDKFIRNCRNLLLQKDIGVPLGILHLIAGDKDRVAMNYGFKIEKENNNELIKIVVLDMDGGWGKNRNKTGSIGHNLFGETNKDEIIKYWLNIKEVVNEKLILKIFEKIPTPTPKEKEMKKNKLKEILNNINNIENLIEVELPSNQTTKKLD